MALKYYSDKTNKFYDTPQEAQRAEFSVKKQENVTKIKEERDAAYKKLQDEKELLERKFAAKKVDDARTKLLEAQKEYTAALTEFVNKYHTYHYSTNNAEEIPVLFGLYDTLFRLWS